MIHGKAQKQINKRLPTFFSSPRPETRRRLRSILKPSSSSLSETASEQARQRTSQARRQLRPQPQAQIPVIVPPARPSRSLAPLRPSCLLSLLTCSLAFPCSCFYCPSSRLVSSRLLSRIVLLLVGALATVSCGRKRSHVAVREGGAWRDRRDGRVDFVGPCRDDLQYSVTHFSSWPVKLCFYVLSSKIVHGLS